MNEKRTWVLATVLLGIAAYLVLFYATELPGLPNVDGLSHRRVIFFLPLLTPEVSAAQWLGTSSTVVVIDRLPVLAVAAAILCCSFVIGWLVLVLGRLDHLLTLLEATVFSLAVGLNLVSTYVLMAGLTGLLQRSAFVLPMAVISAAAGWLWFLLLAIMAVTTVFSSYIYAMPYHKCPFCILKPEYQYIGFIIYFSLIPAAFFGLATVLVEPLKNRDDLADGVRKFQRLTVKISLILLLVLAVTTSYHYLLYMIAGGES